MFSALNTLSGTGSLVLYVLIGIVVLLVIWILRLELKLRRFTRGKNGADLESVVYAVQRGHTEMGYFRSEMEQYLAKVEKRLCRSVQNVKTIRFNPFKGSGTGGNQSFATALLNEDGDGVILSSLYARDHVSMFAKPVKNYQSEHELTSEEREVLSQTRESLSVKHDQ